MPDEKEPLIQDEDRSTQGGPQKGLAFVVIIVSAVMILVIALAIALLL